MPKWARSQGVRVWYVVVSPASAKEARIISASSGVKYHLSWFGLRHLFSGQAAIVQSAVLTVFPASHQVPGFLVFWCVNPVQRGGSKEGIPGAKGDPEVKEEFSFIATTSHRRHSGKMTANPIVYFDISIGGKYEGQVAIEVFSSEVPKTASNFISLCKGDSVGLKGNKLCFEGSPIHRVIPGLWLEGGDIEMGTGVGGESIYGDVMPMEKSHRKHRKGSVSTAYVFPKSSTTAVGSYFKCEGSQFLICLNDKCAPSLSGDRLVFGEVVNGFPVLSAIEKVGTRSGTPSQEIKIEKCGQLY